MRRFFACAGFTLVELMIAVAMLAILLGVGVPNLRNMLLDSRMTALANRVVSSLTAARGTAITRNKPLLLCSNANCNRNEWEEGWVVFVDGDLDGKYDSLMTCRPDVSPTMDCELQFYPPLGGSYTLRLYNNGGVALSKIVYRGLGAVTSDASRASFRLCDARGMASGRTIDLGTRGRPQIRRGTSACP